MKTTLHIVLIAVATTLMSCSQQISPANLPSLVQNSVKATYPQAQNIEWQKAGDLFEAEFEINQVEHTVQVNPAGAITMVKQDVEVAALPAAIDAVLKRDFSDYVVDDLEKVERNGQVFYQVELEKNWQDLQKVFTAEGTPANVSYWE